MRIYGAGNPVGSILQITGCSRTSLMEWCQAYQADHAQGLVDKRVGDKRAKLSKLQIDELHQYTSPSVVGVQMQYNGWAILERGKPGTGCVREIWGGLPEHRHLLHRCGFSYQKTEKVFKSRSEMKVADFEEQVEIKLIDVAQGALETVF